MAAKSAVRYQGQFQALFFLSLGCALFGSFSLGAFALSHVVFHSAAQRGNLGYAGEQGLLLSALTISLVLLSRNAQIRPIQPHFPPGLTAVPPDQHCGLQESLRVIRSSVYNGG